jgi:LytS/YehU family sensor histidine kinase
MKIMNAKEIAFALMMGALGNTLFAISFYLGPISPGIALDFSLIAAFIAGFFGGPALGFISGLLVGALPGIMFGPLGLGSWLGLIGLPLGKALSGLTAGLIAKSLSLGQKPRSSLLGIPATLLAYVPEAIFTYAYFVYLMPFFLAQGLETTIIIAIMLKAIGEVIIMSVIIAALMGNKGFNDFVRTFFSRTRITPETTTAEK